MNTGDRQPELSLRGRAAGSEADGPHREDRFAHPGDHHGGPPSRAAWQGGRPPRGPSIRRIGSRELMGPSGQIIIRHAGDEYHLRVTSKGKLILTK